jgi:uncharacterized protein YraI
VSSKPTTLLLCFILLLTSCSVQVQVGNTATPTPYIITATLPASLTPPPSETSLPPTPQPIAPSVTPAQGITSSQVNVRAEPSTASTTLGVIAANTTVQIVGKDPGGNWWQILYEKGEGGKGWVTAQYVTTATKPEVPVIGGGEANPNAANSAVVIQQLNIRSGPGTSFDSLGILNPNDVVSLSGKNRDGSWLQIEFAAGPEGKGWVNASFVKADTVDGLPIVADSGEVVGTGTPVDTPPPPTLTVVPAAMDFDSADAPLKTVVLEDAGAHTVLYNGDVSAPDGDTEDWIAVTSFASPVFMSIQCSGSNSIQVEIVGTSTTLLCNEPIKAVTVQSGAGFVIHVRAIPQTGPLQYTNYTLMIKASP